MPTAPPPKPPLVEPPAPSRYKIQFTASGELRDKLERRQALLDGDLATVIEAAVTEKLERLEAKRYARTKTPRSNVSEGATAPRSRYIPAAVKRAVFTRDLGQCVFVDRSGRRCTARRTLEFHHHEPFGQGGAHNPATMSLRCRAHNLYAAERDYGTELMSRYRRTDSRVSEPPP